jgi:hypothetical protein
MPSTEEIFTHCGQPVEKHKTLSRKREREGYNTVEVEHRAKRIRSSPPPPLQVDTSHWKTRKFLSNAKREKKLKSMMRKCGMFLTEQTLVGPDEKGAFTLRIWHSQLSLWTMAQRWTLKPRMHSSSTSRSSIR